MSFLARLGISAAAAVAGGTTWVVLEPSVTDAAQFFGIEVKSETPVSPHATASTDTRLADSGLASARPELDLTHHPDAKPSFNCDDASMDMEHLICADPKLAEADRMMGQVWVSLQDRGLVTTNLRLQQNGWIASRNACLIAVNPKDCVRDRILERITVLSSL